MFKSRAANGNGPAKPAAIPAAAEAHCPAETTLENCRTSRNGLTEAEAQERLEHDGPNEVAREKPPAWYMQLLLTLRNPFTLILAGLAIISYLTEDIRAVIVLGSMIVLSVVMRFAQEYRSTQAAERLKAMVTTTATVMRRESEDAPPVKREIMIQDLVVGDIVVLSAGDMIPADVRLLASRDLFVSQAILTGEAVPVEKMDTLGPAAPKKQKPAVAAATPPQPLASEDALDLANICFMGTNIVSGSATVVVVATGKNTYFGSLAKAIVGRRVETAFDLGVNRVTWILIRFMAVMVPVVFFINGFTKGDWFEAFLFAVSVAVGLTPEMLPTVVSANLGKGAITMSRRKCVVKRLNAIQNFGAIDVLCTDKTGTLTRDKIILEQHLDLAGKEDPEILKLGWLNSFHQSGLKNLLDVAVLHYADELKTMEKPAHYTKVDEIPFDFVRRRMSVIVQGYHGEHLLICKGAIEEMLSISSYMLQDGQQVKLEAKHRQRIRRRTRNLNEDGFRVIAVATKELSPDEAKSQYAASDEKHLVLRGFLAFLDPPKESAGPAIAALREHGIAIKILTGDNPVVTRKICKEVGLDIGQPAQGRDVEKLNDEALRQLVETTTVFAKMSPLQKARVVKALQANGHVVGFLGDGINDAPALRDADVGISVDTAADIAKESADIILLEKSLMVLEEGVVEGRRTFANILKYIKMTASSNFGNVFSVLGSSFLLPFLPMLPIQLLTVNLCYDISQVSVPFDRVDREYLARPRKWDASGIARFMMFIGPISSIFDYTTYGVMWWVFDANSPAQQALFQSAWFVESLLSQTMIVYMLRTEKIPFLQSWPSLPVLLATGAVVLIGIVTPYTPFGLGLGMVPLPAGYFPWLAGILLSYCLLTQAIKVWYIRRFGSWL
ncbi:MAG TPA: magnesium-translocating P-type ATPase [Alphaproteobacteria bacterium]|nr:magnesium-translocating P-type ATPase [Alphaproteobacteria bacterium]